MDLAKGFSPNIPRLSDRSKIHERARHDGGRVGQNGTARLDARCLEISSIISSSIIASSSRGPDQSHAIPSSHCLASREIPSRSSRNFRSTISLLEIRETRWTIRHAESRVAGTRDTSFRSIDEIIVRLSPDRSFGYWIVSRFMLRFTTYA